MTMMRTLFVREMDTCVLSIRQVGMFFTLETIVMMEKVQCAQIVMYVCTIQDDECLS